jgi:hypothetical protein
MILSFYLEIYTNKTRNGEISKTILCHTLRVRKLSFQKLNIRQMLFPTLSVQNTVLGKYLKFSCDGRLKTIGVECWSNSDYNRFQWEFYYTVFNSVTLSSVEMKL